MKNIHLLPTNNPSRIYLVKSNNILGITSNNPEFTENFGSGTQNQNIYITSDEVIKEGDLCINIAHKLIVTSTDSDWSNTNHTNLKKIILTTDQYLIKDGVQSIDDEFLEWFIKNQICERVSITIRSAWLENGLIIDFYKITIPTKEPNQEIELGIPKGKLNVLFGENQIDKKIEEAAKSDASKKYGIGYHPDIENAFIRGVNWQKEQYTLEEQYVGHTIDELSKEYIKGFNEGSARQQEISYSEEEVELIANEMVNWAIDNIGNPNSLSGKKFDEVLNKFKKK